MLKTLSATLLIIISITVLSCSSNETNSSKIEAEGFKIVKETFKVLNSELKNAIKLNGPSSAIAICNTRAIVISDSIGGKYGVNIKRTSAKLRNESNIASHSENGVLSGWEEELKENKSISPVITRDQKTGEIAFFAPIKIKGKCLTCHGNSENVPDNVKAKLMRFYPNDKALNYAEGDLRGAWVVTFPKDYFNK